MVAKKLLVADDSLTIQKVIRLALSNEGYEIQAVSDGNDAVQQISTFRPDVILIDVSLPGQSACEVKKAINQFPDLDHIRFVLMSSAFERIDENQVKTVEFHGRLTKPFDPAHLRQILAKALENAPPAKPAVTPGPLPVTTQPQPPPPPPPLPTIQSLEPIQPIEPPPIPDQAEIPMTDLWSEKAPDSDIRELTESTVKMSGLDDFSWTVSEPSLKMNDQPNEPLIPPPIKMADVGGSNFELEEMKPSAPESPSPSFDEPPDEPPPPPAMDKPIVDDPSNVVPVSMVQIEEIIKRQVQENLEKMAQKFLPDVAERVIKEEIHKMLSEQ